MRRHVAANARTRFVPPHGRQQTVNVNVNVNVNINININVEVDGFFPRPGRAAPCATRRIRRLGAETRPGGSRRLLRATSA